jgi:hypothetical protein
MSFMSPSVDNTAAAEEAARQKKITEGKASIDKAFAGFTPDYYQQRARDYTQWGLPQVEDQYSKAAKDLTFALARQYGTTQTSEAAQRQAELTKQYQLAKAKIGETGQDLAAQAQANVEKERQNLQQQLESTADPYAAARSALSSAALLGKNAPFDSLGNLFSDVTGGLAAAGSPYGLIDPATASRYGTTNASLKGAQKFVS